MTHKQLYIYGSLAVVGLATGAYFLLRKEKGAYDVTVENTPTPESRLSNGTKVLADPKSNYFRDLQTFSKSQKLKDVTRTLLTEMNKSMGVNKEQIKNLLYENIPDDEYMKVLKSYFACHKYSGTLKIWVRSKMDLTGWLRANLSDEDFNDLIGKYPTLNYALSCK